jgi:pilus assembly protein CpaB
VKSRLVGGAVAVVLALIGALLVYAYAQGATQRAMAHMDPVEVLVVRDKVPAGTTVEELKDLVEIESQPSGVVAGSALASLDDFAGRVTAVDLVPGEQLVEERLVDPEALQTPGSVPVPAGLQEVTILLEPDRVVGGRIVAGDTVGIFMSFKPEEGPQVTQQVFHKVLVTTLQRAEATAQASGQGGEGSGNAEALPSGSMLVTFAVDDLTASKVIFGAEWGSIWLSKEPADATESAPTPIRFSEVIP